VAAFFSTGAVDNCAFPVDNVEKRVITTGGLAICTMAEQPPQPVDYPCQSYIPREYLPFFCRGFAAISKKQN
jgi:hypothetical protein